VSQPKRRVRKARRCTRIRIGRVSLYEHHGAWWVYYRKGKQPVRRRICEDQASAERIAAELNSQLTSATPLLLDFVQIRVADLQRKFLEHHEQVLRSSVATINRYRTATQHLVDYATAEAGNPSVHELATLGFVAFLRCRRVSANGHANTAKRLLRDKGLQFIVEVCRSMIAFAQRQRHLPPYAVNPFSDVRTDRMRIEDAKPVFVFEADTEVRFLNAACDWEFAIHFTLAKTGMRPGELCHLLIEEVDLANSWLRVCNKPELGWSVKTRNERNVPLVSEVRDVLRHAIGGRSTGVVFRRPGFVAFDAVIAKANRHELREILERRIRESGLQQGHEPNRRAQQKLGRRLWQDAGALDPDQIRRSFLRIASRCGLAQATCPKSWRHTFATLLQDANVDPLLRQITLGHQASGAGGALGMTSVYTHSRPETQARELARALALWPLSLNLARSRASQGSDA